MIKRAEHQLPTLLPEKTLYQQQRLLYKIIGTIKRKLYKWICRPAKKLN